MSKDWEGRKKGGREGSLGFHLVGVDEKKLEEKTHTHKTNRKKGRNKCDEI